MSGQTYTAEQKAEHRAKWAAALRSGNYKQGYNRLRTTDGRFCCLGVACEVAKSEGVIEDPYYSDRDYLPDEVAEWLGITNEGARQGEHALPLYFLNDHKGYGFDQLADVIESGDLELT